MWIPQIPLPAGPQAQRRGGSHFCKVMSWQWAEHQRKYPQEVLPHIFHSHSLERQPDLLLASLDDERRVSSCQAREQLFWFRFSINKKSSESNTLCQLGQQQIPERSGFSLFDKINKPHPTPTRQRDKSLSKEIKPSVLSHLWGETQVGQGCAEPAPGAGCDQGIVTVTPQMSAASEQGAQHWHQQLHLPLYPVGNLDGLVYLFLYLRVGKHGHSLRESFFPFGFNSACSRALLSRWNVPGSVDFQHNKPELQNWPVTDHCKPGPDFKPITKQWKTPYFIFYSFKHKYNLFHALVAQWTQASGAAEVPCKTIGDLFSLGQHCLCFIWCFLCLKFYAMLIFPN